MPQQMTITAVERETGIGKDTLRVWERRYGFPQPRRDANDERLYPPEQVVHLRLIKRLIDQGHRPGKLFSISQEERLLLADPSPAAAPAESTEQHTLISQIFALIKSHDAQGLWQTLNQLMMRQGLQHFVIDTVVPLNHAVGESWMHGELDIFEEHLYSEQMGSLLRQSISKLPRENLGKTRLLLTTVPNEQHALGLLMAESLFALEGANCISLGTQTPLLEIQRAAAAHRADIVALSFSQAFPIRQIAPLLNQLRAMLPLSTELWAGGKITGKLAHIEGVITLPTLEKGLAELRAR
ncbi:MAG: MerR family transcriptional regulator [Betaproteobacteria bacterium]